MSNLAKQKIKIPQNISLKIIGDQLFLKGKLGFIYIPFKVKILIKENYLIVSPNLVKSSTKKKSFLESKSLQGTFISLVKQALTGLSSGFRRRLHLVGVGYKARLVEDRLELKIGCSHRCNIKIPQELKVFCLSSTSISIWGINKQKVNNFAALIRSYKIPEPYKGKGILYQDEKIMLKEGKRS